MSEFTVPGGKCVEAAGRFGRVATIGEVCSLVVRAASTSRAHSSRADPAVAGVTPRPVRRPMAAVGIDHPVPLDTVTAW